MSRFRLIDSHAHVDEIPDFDKSIEAAKKNTIIAIIVPGQSSVSNKKVLELAQLYSGYIFPALGYHPWNLENDFSSVIDEIEQNIDNCVAVGEIGLDYKAKTKKNLQKQVFSILLELASNHNKPVIVHTRYVHETSLAMLRAARIERAVFHSFNGSLDVLNEIIKSGYYISAAPSVWYNEDHARAIYEAPLTNILLETDSPVRWKNCDASPAHTILTLEGVANLKKIDLEIVAENTVINTIKCFNLPDRLIA